MILCKPEMCTACMACVNACHHGAIQIYQDGEFFDYPTIVEDACTDCGNCKGVCPILYPQKPVIENQKYYAAWSKNHKTRFQSSSGGLFPELASYILSKGGIVFGAAFDKNFSVYHTSVDKLSDLPRLQGSKYLQSRIEKSYRKVQQHLESRRPVLFSGTPCQIAGLNAFLKNKKYENLYTIDIICHGVPSPGVFQSYLKYLQKKLKSPITHINFRAKKYSWIFWNISVDAKNNKTYTGSYYKDPYIRGFLRNYFLRPVCYRCPFTSLNRQGDITLGDFWNYKNSHNAAKNFDKLGVSLLICNNEKGDLLFQSRHRQIDFFEESLQRALASNKSLKEPFEKPQNRALFWEDYKSMTFETLLKKWMQKEKIPTHIYIKSHFKMHFVTHVMYFFAINYWRVMKRIKKLATIINVRQKN